jgi:cytochrome c biogenesis protein CcmG/thiol:disulfide interchange protein DsbE
VKPWAKIALLAVAAVVVTQLLVRPPARVERGAPAPPLALPDLQGRTVDLSGLRGRVVAVNFWATWCGPCLAEIPELAEVWRRHQGGCFELLGVAEESDRADVARAAADMPYPVLVDGRRQVGDAWGVPGYPHTYLVDREGRLVQVFRGAVTRRDLEDAIAPLLPSSCPGR